MNNIYFKINVLELFTFPLNLFTIINYPFSDSVKQQAVHALSVLSSQDQSQSLVVDPTIPWTLLTLRHPPNLLHQYQFPVTLHHHQCPHHPPLLKYQLPEDCMILNLVWWHFFDFFTLQNHLRREFFLCISSSQIISFFGLCDILVPFTFRKRRWASVPWGRYDRVNRTNWRELAWRKVWWPKWILPWKLRGDCCPFVKTILQRSSNHEKNKCDSLRWMFNIHKFLN